MKKHADFVPLEISGDDLEDFVAQLRDKLFNEFWSDITDDEKKEMIKSRLTKNIVFVLDDPRNNPPS